LKNKNETKIKYEAKLEKNEAKKWKHEANLNLKQIKILLFFLHLFIAIFTLPSTTHDIIPTKKSVKKSSSTVVRGKEEEARASYFKSASVREKYTYIGI